MNPIQKINQVIGILLFLFCGSVFLNAFTFKFLHILITLFVILSLIVQKKYDKIVRDKFLIGVTSMSFFLLINWFITDFDLKHKEYFTMFFFIVLAHLIHVAFYFDKKLELENFDLMLKIVTFHAALNFIVANLFTDYFTILEGESYKCRHLFYCFYYLADYEFFGIEIIRNQGLYWEPGVLAAVLNIFLFRLLFGKQMKYSAFYIGIILFCIVTTCSTTGFMVFSILIVYKIIKYDKSKPIAIAKLALIGLLFSPIVFSNLEEKFSGKGENSYIARNYDFLVAIDVLQNNPVVGVGFSKAVNDREQTKSPLFFESFFSEAHGNTNSIITIFLYLGIPLGIFFLYFFYKQNLVLYEKQLFFVINLLLLSSEPLIFSFFYIFLFSSYFYKQKVNQ